MVVQAGERDGGHEGGWWRVTAMRESEPRLRDQLDRWIAAEIIDAGQAARIESAEQAGAAVGDAGAAPRRALPLMAEVLGYFGAVVAISAGYFTVRKLWPGESAAATLTFSAVVMVLLAVIGAVLLAGGEAAYARLRSVLWLLATAAGVSFAAVLASAVLHLGGRIPVLIAAVAWAGLAVAFWWRGKSVLQHVVLFSGLVALLVAGLSQLDHRLTLVGYGTAIWVLSAVWGVVAYRGLLAPPAAGLASASVGVLAGSNLTIDNPAGQVLAMLTVAGLLALGVTTHRVLFTGFGAAGTLFVVPYIVGDDLAGSVAAPFAVAVAGLALLAVALWLARARGKAG
jgi:hypothetical protein